MSTMARRLPVIYALLVFALVLVVIRRAPSIASLLLGGFILAYVCAPIVDRLDRRIPRAAATALVFFGLFLVIAGMVLMLVPVLVTQWKHLVERLPAALDMLVGYVPTIEAKLGIDIPTEQGALVEKLRAALGTGGASIAATAGAFAGKTFGGVLGILGAIVNFGLLMPMLAFYILQNYHDIWPQVLAWVPPRSRSRLDTIKTEIDAALGGFIRGQLTVALIVGAIFAVGLTIVGIEGAIVIGLINGFMNMIPLVGSVFGITLSLTLAILKFAGWWPIIGVLIVYGVEAVLENTIITPRVIGNKVGLPPFAVLLSVLAFGELFGFVGTLLAVPAAAVIKVLLSHLRESYVTSVGYTAGAPVAPRSGGPPPAPSGKA
jgi:predicted PurR-regulated permease PerM